MTLFLPSVNKNIFYFWQSLLFTLYLHYHYNKPLSPLPASPKERRKVETL